MNAVIAFVRFNFPGPFFKKMVYNTDKNTKDPQQMFIRHLPCNEITAASFRINRYLTNKTLQFENE